MAKKVTIAENFTNIENYLRTQGKDEWADFIAERREVASHKSDNRKPTERQLENAELAVDIEQFLHDNAGTAFYASEIAAAVPSCNGLNPQRMAPILNKMDGIKFKEDKGRKRFYMD